MDRNIIMVSRFAHREAKYSSGAINLWEWLLFENEYTPLVHKIRSTASELERRTLKEKLPGITVSCISKMRGTGNVLHHTGYICIDIDGKDNPRMINIELLKKQLADNKHIIYCGLSASGTGVFCVIPIENPAMHKQHFYALERDFKEVGIVVDSSCSDVCRLRFYSYDDKPYINRKAEVYKDVWEKNTQRKHSVEIRQNVSASPACNGIPMIMGPILERIALNEIDITINRSIWFKIGCSLANEFGEEGRSVFHAVSRFYHTPKYEYTEKETDMMYDGCLRSEYKRKYSIGTFYHYLKENGIL